ncbi:ABC transporter ATP-binding protein [Spongiibacter thalassae]|uniref:ABC transporter ATP-binding protein n=1 Tax=Spongiibacter thalassae TaxID=2721624 RepID=UPI001B2FFD7F|nr:oligopeptide/dipeptide ABC transporter ATP-binding protein [Spongiibacter thalassae]
MINPLLKVEDLTLHFPQSQGFLQPKRLLRAVDGVSFSIQPGETLGLVGESGCGKSSLGKALLNLHRPTSGRVLFRGENIAGLSDREKRPLRRKMQIIFQDPSESLNSRHTVGTIIEEPLIIHRLGDHRSRQARVNELLDMVGLPASAADKYPHEFSGGQRQRIGIARAIALKPELLVCDEAVSALDVSVQAQILNLLLDIQQELSLSMLFISHDISVVQHMSDRIAVMYLGRLLEVAGASSVTGKPRHPYTRALMDSVPKIGSSPVERAPLSGDLPSPMAIPTGCRFAARCPHRTELCTREEPALIADPNTAHQTACHHWREIIATTASAV